MGSVPSPASAQLPASPQGGANQVGDLPDWLTGILSDADKSQVKSGAPSAPSAPSAIRRCVRPGGEPHVRFLLLSA